MNKLISREDSKRLLTIEEVAFQLSLSKSKVYELLSTGSIQVVRIGRARRVSPGDLDRFIEKSKTSNNGFDPSNGQV